MKILLVGPLPPPNGGISVHVMQSQTLLTAAGVECDVLDPSKTPGKFLFVGRMAHYASRGWAIHLHTNGHNTKSWLMALICGAVARLHRVNSTLTLHSGMVPEYLAGPTRHRTLARLACGLQRDIICVSPAIAAAIASLAVDSQRIEMRPAFIAPEPPARTLDKPLIAWMENHRPLLTVTMFFRPEYGFPLLVEAMTRLRQTYPNIGCVVMGSCEHGEDAFDGIRHASLESQMLLLGDVEHDRCLSIMAASDVYVRPTLHDGDSLSVREALALGVPVVASRTGNRPDGIHLFQAGNVDDLVAQALSVLPAAMEAAAERRVCA